MLTTLLNEMDGFDALNGVFILAATNKPAVLDPAIMRPGRFGTHIYLGPPNAAARREIFEMKLKGIPVEEGFQLDELVGSTEGRSGKLTSLLGAGCWICLRQLLQWGTNDVCVERLTFYS